MTFKQSVLPNNEVIAAVRITATTGIIDSTLFLEQNERQVLFAMRKSSEELRDIIHKDSIEPVATIAMKGTGILNALSTIIKSEKTRDLFDDLFAAEIISEDEHKQLLKDFGLLIRKTNAASLEEVGHGSHI